MVKLQFGSGENNLEGWHNLQEREADITKPLAFNSDGVDYILAEHVVEHVTPKQAWDFFCECYRILKPQGVARIIVPDVTKMYNFAREDYFEFVKNGAKIWWQAAGLQWEDRAFTMKDAIKTIIFCHGHQACWNEQLLKTVLSAVGFSVHYGQYGDSVFPELKGVDGHWKMMGLERCRLESCVVEAQKIGHTRSYRPSLSSCTAEPDAFRQCGAKEFNTTFDDSAYIPK